MSIMFQCRGLKREIIQIPVSFQKIDDNLHITYDEWDKSFGKLYEFMNDTTSLIRNFSLDIIGKADLLEGRHSYSIDECLDELADVVPCFKEYNVIPVPEVYVRALACFAAEIQEIAVKFGTKEEIASIASILPEAFAVNGETIFESAKKADISEEKNAITVIHVGINPDFRTDFGIK